MQNDGTEWVWSVFDTLGTDHCNLLHNLWVDFVDKGTYDNAQPWFYDDWRATKFFFCFFFEASTNSQHNGGHKGHCDKPGNCNKERGWKSPRFGNNSRFLYSTTCDRLQRRHPNWEKAKSFPGRQHGAFFFGDARFPSVRGHTTRQNWKCAESKWQKRASELRKHRGDLRTSHIPGGSWHVRQQEQHCGERKMAMAWLE